MAAGAPGFGRARTVREERNRVKKFLRKHPDIMNEVINELRMEKIKKLKI